MGTADHGLFFAGFEKRAKGERVVAAIGKTTGKAKRGPKPKDKPLTATDFYSGEGYMKQPSGKFKKFKF